MKTMKTFNLATSICLAIVLGALRASGEKGQFFQACAHMFTAWMFAAYWFGAASDPKWRRAYLAIGIGLTVLEVVCFLAFRHTV